MPEPQPQPNLSLSLSDVIKAQQDRVRALQKQRQGIDASIRKQEQHRADLREQLQDQYEGNPADGVYRTAQGIANQIEDVDLRIRNLGYDASSVDGEIAAAQQRLAQLERCGATPSGESNTARLNTAVAEHRNALAALKARQGELAQALALSPGNAETLEDVSLVDEQIEATERRIALYEQGASAAIQADQQAIRAARVHRAIQAFNATTAAVAHAEQIAEELQTYLTGLGPVIERWNEAITEARQHFATGCEITQRRPGYGDSPDAKCISGAALEVIQSVGLLNLLGDAVQLRWHTTPSGETIPDRVHKVGDKVRELLEDAINRMEV